MATIKLTQDFKEFLNLLNSEQIEYLLIGGYAVWLYGYMRPTKDIDIWVATDPANESRILEVLVKFGFDRLSLKRPLFPDNKTQLRMGFPPNQIELLSHIAGVDFRECYARRRMMEIEGMMIPVIDYDDLLQNKRAANREGDRVDVSRLEKRRRKP